MVDQDVGLQEEQFDAPGGSVGSFAKLVCFVAVSPLIITVALFHYSRFSRLHHNDSTQEVF